MSLLAFRPGTHRSRPVGRHATGWFLLAAYGCAPSFQTGESDGSAHLFAWAWDVDQAIDDFLTVVDGDPVQPRLFADFGDAGPYTHPHSFARTPSGTVLATYQCLVADHSATGGLVELDGHGRMLRAASAADPLDPDIHPYSLAVIPRLDRVVTTSADMHGEEVGRSVQVWRLSDLVLLHTVLLPPGPRGDEHLHCR